MQGHDPAEDRFALVTSLCVLRDDARPDLHFLAKPEHAGKDGATGDAALELVDLRTRLVHVEGTDDDQAGVGSEVAHGDGDTLDDVLIHGVDVVFELSGDGDDG